jgi:phosphate transport system protein
MSAQTPAAARAAHPHLEQALQRDIDQLRAKVQAMGQRAQRAMDRAARAMLEANRQVAYAVILQDLFIDESEKELDRLCLEFLTRHQPVAGHLRFAYATLKITNELERIGDYAESIARQALKLLPPQPRPDLAKFRELAQLAQAMLQQAMRAYADQSADLAQQAMRLEEAADELRASINHDLFEAWQSGRLPVPLLNPCLTIARRFERAADQARNICEEIVYMCTGEYVRHKGGDAFHVLFVDDDHACTSRMAEAIGRALGDPRFVFTSAGLRAAQPDPRLDSFLRERGVEPPPPRVQTAAQAVEATLFQVLVALSPAAVAAFPAGASKRICLDWPITDPASVQGSEDQVRAAYQAAFDFLQAQIRDLVRAARGEEPTTPKTHAIQP